MMIKKIGILPVFLLLLACSDYPEGYRDGVANSDKRQWVIFGKSKYLQGYASGQAEKFQQEWLLENPVDESIMHCPSIVQRAEPLMFMPTEYSQIGTDIYSH